MPIYDFLNTETNEEFQVDLKLAELDDYKKSNPHFTQLIKAVNHVLHTGGLKPPSGFRDLSKHIKKNNIGANIDTGNISEI